MSALARIWLLLQIAYLRKRHQRVFLDYTGPRVRILHGWEVIDEEL